METYASADQTLYEKQEEDRSSSAKNSIYFLPADEGEWTRLNKQHAAFILGLGALYPAKETVRAILAPQEGETKKILDLGCGSGVWTIDMAKEFPHATVIGLDLAPVPVASEPSKLPPNCTFETKDINLGLSQYKDQFDVVNCRLISAGLKDHLKAKEEAENCLKPGGILIWTEVDYDMLEWNRIEYAKGADGSEGNTGSWVARMSHDMTHTLLTRAKNNVKKMGDIISEGLWDDQLMDPESCRTAILYLPEVPWTKDIPEDEAHRITMLGKLMQDDISNAFKAFVPALKKLGGVEEQVDDVYGKAIEEIRSLSHPLWSRWAFAWGRRRGGPDLSSYEPVEAEEGKQVPPPYPYFSVIDNKETALDTELKRRKRRDVLGLPNA